MKIAFSSDDKGDLQFEVGATNAGERAVLEVFSKQLREQEPWVHTLVYERGLFGPVSFKFGTERSK